MSVVGLEIARREPFAGGHVFGAGGAYERIDGLLRFGVDPTLAENAAVVDLDKAPRNADGKVDFLWRNLGTGANQIQLFNGVVITSTVPLIAEADLNWSVAAVRASCCR